MSGQSRHLKDDIPLPPGITRREWHELCDQLTELEAAGALGGIRAIVAERLAYVRAGVSYDEVPMAMEVIRSVPVSSAPGSPRHRQLLAQAAAHLAAEIDRAGSSTLAEAPRGTGPYDPARYADTTGPGATEG
jgi:hypothetical protein